jgi:AcrR family transcriptional regulator
MASGKTTPTRDRILMATADLLRRRGYNGTGLKAIVKASEAPFGSIYHFFPGGKEELGAEAIRTAGRTYNALIQAFFESATDIPGTTKAFFDGAAEVLKMTDYEDACPIATVALEVASTSEPMREASGDVFESWISDLCADFEALGMDQSKTRELAVLLLMLIEGAFLLCRSWKNTVPMEIAGRAAVEAVTDALR